VPTLELLAVVALPCEWLPLASMSMSDDRGALLRESGLSSELFGIPHSPGSVIAEYCLDRRNAVSLDEAIDSGPPVGSP
jgi:hypothetical protein